MYLKFDKERWVRDKEYFNDIIDLNVELMDELKEYFFGFVNAPVDLYMNHHIESYSKLFHSKDELISYCKEEYENGVKLVLYCILTKGDSLILRSSILPNI